MSLGCAQIPAVFALKLDGEFGGKEKKRKGLYWLGNVRFSKFSSFYISSHFNTELCFPQHFKI